jgi:hypothetical protein
LFQQRELCQGSVVRGSVARSVLCWYDCVHVLTYQNKDPPPAVITSYASHMGDSPCEGAAECTGQCGGAEKEGDAVLALISLVPWNHNCISMVFSRRILLGAFFGAFLEVVV